MLCLFNICTILGINPIGLIAQLIGTTEPALKILISILFTYPQAKIYNKYVRRQSTVYHNLYFIGTGLDIAIFNFGFGFYHNIIPVVVFMLSSIVLGHGQYQAMFTFLFNMMYLIYGYIVTESEDYDITWTMPQCVLTLKMTALSFDLWDGQKKKSELSANNSKTMLKEMPELLELLGFVYFPPCFLVGPMFSFRRYKSFISGEYPEPQEGYAFTKLIVGLIYLITFQVGVSVFSMQHMLSDEFLEKSIFYRHIYCGLWAHFALYKYISCWLLTEAACIRYGFSYNGLDEKLNVKWDGCTNIKLIKFEKATRFQHYIDSFNCNTNYFASEYVYKRLKFLGNRNLSQMLTLLFLAVWHGTQSGYYATFFNEFIIMIMEKDLEPMLVKTKLYHQIWANPVGKVALWLVLKTYTIVFMGWSLVPISLKIFPRWFEIYKRLYFSGYIFFLPWAFAYKPLLKNLLKRLPPQTEKRE